MGPLAQKSKPGQAIQVTIFDAAPLYQGSKGERNFSSWLNSKKFKNQIEATTGLRLELSSLPTDIIKYLICSYLLIVF